MKPKLLIVDDDPLARQAMAEPLQSFVCEILEAGDGAEGMALARRESPSVILLDMIMPGVDGLEMLQQLRAGKDTRDIPVIMVTGRSQREDVMRILRLGVQSYLVKPYSHQDLIQRVGDFVQLIPVGAAPGTRRVEDPLKLLLVEDKAVICDRVRQNLGKLPWNLETISTAAEAFDSCAKSAPDAVLVSLSLPHDAGCDLVRRLREDPRFAKLPVFGLCPAPETGLQKRGLEHGCTGIIAKPIQPGVVKARIVEALRLDTSGNYFEQVDGVLVAHWPAALNSETTGDLMQRLPGSVSSAIDSGIDKLAIDLAAVTSAHPVLIRLLAGLVKLCQELGLRYRLAASEGLSTECRKYDEARHWEFSSSLADALTSLNGGGAKT